MPSIASTPFLPPGVPIRKRLFDLALGVPLLVLGSPILLLTALVILIVDGPPLTFLRQPRPGYRGQIFDLVKFRTMRDQADSGGAPLPDAQRLSPLGRLLRATSLDELPELLHVVRGQMSLVGPRPLLVQYVERYSPEQARRHAVLPGMTGWAQVNGDRLGAGERISGRNL